MQRWHAHRGVGTHVDVCTHAGPGWCYKRQDGNRKRREEGGFKETQRE